MSNKASKNYWDANYSDKRIKLAGKDNMIRQWIEHYVEASCSEHKSCIEIGCYPGKYLSIFGELGYELSGIDFCKQLPELPVALANSGYKIGEFLQEDFLQYSRKKKYDVVCSFGFIEHFENWKEVLEQHGHLVKPGGLLLVEAPNFIGSFQHWLHSKYDRQNYDRHYIPSMDVELWSECFDENEFEIKFVGYFGHFHYWLEDTDHSLAQKLILKGLKTIKKPLKAILPEGHKAYAPYAGLVARKKTAPN